MTLRFSEHRVDACYSGDCSLNRSWARYSSRVQRGNRKSQTMLNTVRLLFLCLSLGAAIAAPQTASANGRCEGVSSAQGVSFGTVVNNIRKRLRDPGGRPLKACTERRGNGKAVIKVKWLTSDDRLLDVTVDARTGAILGVRGN